MKTRTKTKQTLILILIFVSLGVACKKEIATQGPQGEKGIAGPAGSTVLSGNGVPAAATGVIGDFYLDLATSNFYGPKKADGWGVAFLLKGQTGATGNTGAVGNTGAPGSQIISGTGIPDAVTGTVGDYFLDKTSYNLYGPKVATGWGTALSLKGTANVIYSGWNVAKNFRDTTSDNTALKAADLLAPALTTAVINGGLVQVYFNFGGGVYALPYSSYAGGKLNTISYFPRLGHFIITRFTADNSNSIPLSTALQYRYVIIPGGTAVALAKDEGLKLTDYEAVKKFYAIKD